MGHGRRQHWPATAGTVRRQRVVQVRTVGEQRGGVTVIAHAEHQHINAGQFAQQAVGLLGRRLGLGDRSHDLLDLVGVQTGEPEAFGVTAGQRLDQVGERAGGLGVAAPGQHHEEAGARCTYPVGAPDADTLQRLLDALAGPVNVIANPRKGSAAGSLEDLQAMGVHRVTFGPKLMQELAPDLTALVTPWR